jgi:tetratricopeptide (TPR) repeat protein
MATLIHSRNIRTQPHLVLYGVIMPLLGGSAMLGASLLPWLVDPLGAKFSAWQLPIDIGWQVRSGLFSYAILCLCCTLYALLIAYRAWHHWQMERSITTTSIPYLRALHSQVTALRRHYTTAGLLCLVPLGLFFIQILFIDMGHIAQLSHHEMQARSIKSHFGYRIAPLFISSSLDQYTLGGRFALLLNQSQPGFYLPLLATFCLLMARRTLPRQQQQAYQYNRRHLIAIGVGLFFLLIVLLRSPLALASNFVAEHLLARGDYPGALAWLDRAKTLNPALEQLPQFHIERGQAWYYLHPRQPTTESQTYLANFYRTQGDYLSAYQALLATLQQNPDQPVPSWLQDELCVTLLYLAEVPHPLAGTPAQRSTRDLPSISWLNRLIQVEPNNAYAHYMLGRIKYDLHDYTASNQQLLTVLDLSSNPDIRSSVYTYLALNSKSEGNLAKARDYLFKAQDLDPSYFNNTTRGELSGLH